MATNSVITKVTGTDSSSNRVGSTFYGTCTDAATTAAKTVVLADSCVFNNSCLVTGVTIHVKFTNSNTYAKPALQVSNASPKPIMAHGTTYVGTTPETSWYAGAVVSFTYDGTYWVMNDYKIDTDTNTWRDVKLNGTQILGTSTSTGSLNIVPGTYMNITNSSGSVTFEPKETQVTQAQYDALVQAGTVDADTTYFITDRNNAAATYAAGIAYDNTASGLPATTVQGAIDAIISAIYPVGSIYMSVNNVNPGTYLTGTTWEAWGSGRVPVGVDTSQTEFDTVEETGGEKSHPLTIGEIPSHAGHNINDKGKGSYKGKYISINNTTVFSTYGTDGRGWDVVRNDEIDPHTENLGGGGAHNNLQPYITCYMWKRVS